MFKKILVANRGEIALRVILSCKEMGIKTVAVFSEADRHALHVRFADEAICIGPPKSIDSYLNIPSVISAAELSGADAIHPGYGFLSESGYFAEVCEASHIKFQIMADEYGNVIHLGERECSIQRRHQKLIEESPSVIMTPELRSKLGQSIIQAMKDVGYANVGTLEFLVDERKNFYFME